ncbi:radical SAM protein [Clostridium cellulovorans]|uniref:Radical SAM domain protein n=1 Tax=Clostridium cellulovorans (strain ATCC 35296 / DSM 3052 / OCM 3 / 743B) TaxID=573061 RepID=D9SKV7_CLOC7|nr:radical SAM protein [Clostridium cellulovorans]ADL53529.1 Radical SAM domain protein [Clostridium cellulovorans 743B]
MKILENCTICPRACAVNRINGEKGFCLGKDTVKVARVSLHHWEEPCISGDKGSGTVFFSNCNLRCIFCQNHQISQDNVGKEITISRLSDIFIEQQERGAHNINLVTPTHYAFQIIEALALAKDKGLNIPIIYNSNGYEETDTIKALNGYIDVYLPDLKYYDDKYALKYSKAPNYFEKASKAIEEMFNQVGEAQFDENGLIKKGIIIRHMLLPTLIFDSKKIIDYIIDTFDDKVYVSLMNQYTPMYNAKDYPEINKSVKSKVYDALIDYAIDKGLTKGFIQESGTSTSDFTPDFDLRNV